MEFSKRLKSYKIVDSGNLIVPYNESIEYNINDLKYVVKFEYKEDAEETQIFTKVISNGDEKYMEISIIGRGRSFFEAPNSMLNVGNFNGKKLFFLFSVQSINIQEENGIEDKIFYYTWLMEE